MMLLLDLVTGLLLLGFLYVIYRLAKRWHMRKSTFVYSIMYVVVAGYLDLLSQYYKLVAHLWDWYQDSIMPYAFVVLVALIWYDVSDNKSKEK